MENFRGIYLDENKEKLSINDQNLVKDCFNIGGEEKTSWKKPSYETIEWHNKDLNSMKEWKNT